MLTAKPAFQLVLMMIFRGLLFLVSRESRCLKGTRWSKWIDSQIKIQMQLVEGVVSYYFIIFFFGWNHPNLLRRETWKVSEKNQKTVETWISERFWTILDLSILEFIISTKNHWTPSQEIRIFLGWVWVWVSELRYSVFFFQKKNRGLELPTYLCHFAPPPPQKKTPAKHTAKPWNPWIPSYLPEPKRWRPRTWPKELDFVVGGWRCELNNPHREIANSLGSSSWNSRLVGGRYFFRMSEVWGRFCWQKGGWCWC